MGYRVGIVSVMLTAHRPIRAGSIRALGGGDVFARLQDVPLMPAGLAFQRAIGFAALDHVFNPDVPDISAFGASGIGHGAAIVDRPLNPSKGYLIAEARSLRWTYVSTI